MIENRSIPCHIFGISFRAIARCQDPNDQIDYDDRTPGEASFLQIDTCVPPVVIIPQFRRILHEVIGCYDDPQR